MDIDKAYEVGAVLRVYAATWGKACGLYQRYHAGSGISQGLMVTIAKGDGKLQCSSCLEMEEIRRDNGGEYNLRRTMVYVFAGDLIPTFCPRCRSIKVEWIGRKPEYDIAYIKLPPSYRPYTLQDFAIDLERFCGLLWNRTELYLWYTEIQGKTMREIGDIFGVDHKEPIRALQLAKSVYFGDVNNANRIRGITRT